MPEVTKNHEPKVEMNKTRGGVWLKKDFSASALLFWIKGSVAVDYRFVRIVEQNTILGLIPAGNNKQNIPLKNISGVSVNTSYKVKRFILGIIVALIGLSVLDSSALMGLIILLIGVATFLNGILTEIEIEKSGSSFVLYVPFFNKADIISIQQGIEQALSNDIDKTDMSLYNHRLEDDDIDDIK
ncbi:hypothetical protein [Liquorilactobacillus uvarum]|uniref:hypothetical protein n=2 Tax=Bacillati TaxID=1783272 RepID=UPI0028898945|nr:hypothetical protein [Liquorilactobacillus uvarum]